MISTLKKLQERKATQGSEGGFTLIELLIVIVVLGILAAVVVFSLGSVTSQSAVAACQADGATVNTAMSAYNANIGSYPQSAADLTGTGVSGGPYLQSWPNNPSHYVFELAESTAGDPKTIHLYLTKGGVTPATALTAYGSVPSSSWVLWTGAGTCTTTAPATVN